MGAPYTSVSISGYNSNPPPDDGTQTEANRVKYDTTKTKLADPVKTLAETIDTNIGTAFGKVVGGAGITSTAISYQVLSTDQGKLVRATGSSITITTPDATDVDDPFVFALHNESSGTVTLDGSGSQTIDGGASITLAAGEGIAIFTDGSNWFTIGRNNVSESTSGFVLLNGIMGSSVGSNALTISILDKAANTPSAANPVFVVIRNSTAVNPAYTLMAITAATTLVISSGSTMGASNGAAFRLWVVGFNDAGTFRLGAINCRNGLSIFPLAPWSIASSTAEGGAGGADSAHTIYTGTAVSSKPYQLVGYLTWESGLAAAGTWNILPTRNQNFGLGVPLPGQTVQTAANTTGALATTTTSIPLDDTIPQSGEGVEVMSQAITPSSAANLLDVRHVGFYSCNPGATGIAALFQDATASALAAVAISLTANTDMGTIPLNWALLAATTSATTFKIRAGSSAGATLSFNGSNAARLFGGVAASTLSVAEIMG